METMRQDWDILSQEILWSAGRRNLHTRRTMVREKSRFLKIKNIKRNKSFIWMREREKERERKRERKKERKKEREREKERKRDRENERERE